MRIKTAALSMHAFNGRFGLESEDFFRLWLKTAFRVLVVVMGAMHTWAAVVAHSMSEDGINYLDMGDAYLRGDWGMALNTVWSPMYAWILGLVQHVVRPPMRWEFPVVQFVNFGIYLSALMGFEFFWRELTRYRQNKTWNLSDGTISLPYWAWEPLGYSLFLWSSLSLINIWAVTPDMLMTVWVYIAAGLILRIRMGLGTWSTFGVLGMILGFAFLTKAVMFPLAFIFLVVALFSTEHFKTALPRVTVAFVVFLLLSGPYIAAISTAKGRLTFGDAGRLTYARYVNGIPYPHWQGGPAENGTPDHPSRKIWNEPPIYEFGDPVGGTYPIGYDPSYWYEGMDARMNIKRQFSRIMAGLLFYFDLFLHRQGVLVAAAFFVFWTGYRKKISLRHVFRRAGLLAVAFAALGIYALVYVEERYIGVFLVLLWADILAGMRFPRSRISGRLASGVSVAMVLFLLLNVFAFNVKGLIDLGGSAGRKNENRQPAKAPSGPGEVAEELLRLGVAANDKVGVIGYGFGAFWARLARVQIAAEVLYRDADDLRMEDLSPGSEVIRAFAATGIKAIVAECMPACAGLEDWHRVGRSDCYIHVLEHAGKDE
ncbi:MAG: hypothetical protein R6U50_12765 [Desulfobacterales bacterium]